MEKGVVDFLQDNYTFDDSVLIERVLAHVNPKKRPAPKTSSSTTTTTKTGKAKGAGRHVVWNPFEKYGSATGTEYVLIRPGIAVKNEEEVDRLFKEKSTLNEGYFYLFKHSDPNVRRNKRIPLYEAAYYCSERGYYLRVQKCHMKQAYANSGRCDKDAMWSVLENGQPYWVDRHAFCKESQRESKRKYESKQKKNS